MFVAIKNMKIIAIHEMEWGCRKKAKGFDLFEYWTWLESVTTVTGTPPDDRKTYDFSGEDYEIHEVDVDVAGFTASGHIVSNLEGTHYHLKWDGSSVSADDDALATYQTAEKWKDIRSQRDALLSDTDWVVVKAKETGGNISASWKKYRQDLRDVPTQSDPDNITWPTKPS
tara:strand:- start:2324 stop:2836 length:513 start_codon:yes stop_codon:yes gene_type:complete